MSENLLVLFLGFPSNVQMNLALAKSPLNPDRCQHSSSCIVNILLFFYFHMTLVGL